MTATQRLVITAFTLIAAVAGLPAAQITTTWSGGAGTWNTPANWDNGVPNNGASTYTVRIDNGNATVSPVTLDISPTIDNLSISAGDSLAISNGVSFTVTSGAGAGTITNAGTMSLNGSSSLFRPANGTVTLTGGGTFTLSDDINNLIFGASPSDRLLNVNNTIQGAGQIGQNFLALTNQGVIVANAAVNPLIVDANDTDGIINTGTLRAASGGVLRLQADQITNTGGTIEALNSSRVELTGTTVSGGALSTAGTGLIRVTGTSALDGSAPHTVTTSGAFELAAGVICDLFGTVSNSGTITLRGGSCLLRPRGGAVTLSGGGTVTLIDDVNNLIYGLASTDRLVNVDNTIQGAGQLGENFLAITNQHLIVANAPNNPLIIDPNDTDGLLNTGTLRAASGGVLRLQAGAFTNTGATIEALNNSRVELTGVTITGGAITTAGTGLIRVTGQSTLDGSPSHTVTNSGSFEIASGVICNLLGTISNSGNMTMKGGSDLLRPSGGSVSLTGGGTLTLIDDVNNQIYGVAPSDRLINVNNTIQGAGQIGENFIALTNQSLIVANAPNNPLIIDANDTDGVTNTGTLRATAGGVLKLQAGPYNNVGGTIEAQTGSRVELTGATIIGGTITSAGTGLLRQTGESLLDGGSSHVVTNAGAYEINPGVICDLRGTISNSGTMTMKGSSALLHPGGGTVSLTGGGTFTLTDDSSNQIYGVLASDRLINVDNTIQGAGQIGENFMSFTNQGTVIANGTAVLQFDPTDAGDFTNQGSLQATGTGGINIVPGPFITSGTVTIAAASQLNRTGNYTQTAGTTTVNGALHTNSGIVDIQGGVLKGSGTITSDVNSAGSVQPGNSPGILSITGNYTQTAGAELAIEIGGTTVGTQYDRLAISAVANLAGTLRVSLINGFNPNIGDSFTVLTYASYTGSFSTYSVPCGLSGKVLQVDVGPTAVKIIVSAAPAADINCDCVVTIEDAYALTLALVDPAGFVAAYPGCNINHADLNGDGFINGKDIAVFVHEFAP